jgi:hypothetical protein
LLASSTAFLSPNSIVVGLSCLFPLYEQIIVEWPTNCGGQQQILNGLPFLAQMMCKIGVQPLKIAPNSFPAL